MQAARCKTYRPALFATIMVGGGSVAWFDGVGSLHARFAITPLWLALLVLFKMMTSLVSPPTNQFCPSHTLCLPPFGRSIVQVEACTTSR